MKRCTVDLHATPFKGDEFGALWRPHAARALDFGATAYSFVRSEDDPLHFTFSSDWPNPDDFDDYWYGDKLSQAREEASGLVQVPILPAWVKVISSGSA